MMGFLQSLFENLQYIIAQFRFKDLLDLFLVWFIFYRFLLLVKRSGAAQIIIGIVVLGFSYFLSTSMELTALNWLLEKLFSNLLLITVILFQSEIRAALAQIGSHALFRDVSKVEETHMLEEIVQSAVQIAQRGHGALFVLEREIAIDYFIEWGTKMEANINAATLVSIFLSDSPIHDGAVVFRDGKIHSAGCFLPLSRNPVLDRNLGTRHRAALGLTEETDAVVLVISEETSGVGLAMNGQLHLDVDIASLRKKLFEAFGLTKVAKDVKAVQ